MPPHMRELIRASDASFDESDRPERYFHDLQNVS